MGFRFSPCGCCGPACLIFEDQFTRADSTTIGNDWTEVNGDWEIASNNLSVDSTAAIITHDGSGQEEVVIKTTVRGTDAGDKLRAIVCYLDDDNYLFAQVTLGSVNGTLGVYKRVAGVETLLTLAEVAVAGAVPDYDIEVTVCYNGTGIGATARGDSLTTYNTYGVATAPGIEVGLGTGSVLADTAIFTYFLVYEHFGVSSGSLNCESCPGGECLGCTNDESANSYKVVISGWANNACSGCDELNGTWILKKCGSCYFERTCNTSIADYSPCPGSGSSDRMTLTFTGGATKILQLVMVVNGQSYKFTKNYGADEIECRTLYNEELPYDTCVGFFCNRCDPSDATVLVTAL